ncbi:MAG: hypothetical protein JRM98_03580 [Nitrososphaerota archaeon]|jgi:hypothetical protein|nr:hypothetical protein [Nitrososphaerota archaeon]
MKSESEGISGLHIKVYTKHARLLETLVVNTPRPNINQFENYVSYARAIKREIETKYDYTPGTFLLYQRHGSNEWIMVLK